MTRLLDEECEHCGGKKEMYYTPWCSNCNVPSIKTVTTLNLLKCFRHIERKYYGIVEETMKRPRDRVWEGLCDWSGMRNDVTIWLPIIGAADGDGSIGDLSDDSIEFLQHVVKVFKLRDHPNLLWEVSW